jgi:hypothetical protein
MDILADLMWHESGFWDDVLNQGENLTGILNDRNRCTTEVEATPSS